MSVVTNAAGTFSTFEVAVCICGRPVYATGKKGAPAMYHKGACQQLAQRLGDMRKALEDMQAAGYMTPNAKQRMRSEMWLMLNQSLNGSSLPAEHDMYAGTHMEGLPTVTAERYAAKPRRKGSKAVRKSA